VSATVSERARTATVPPPRTERVAGGAVDVPAQRTTKRRRAMPAGAPATKRNAATQRAYARRDERLRRRSGGAAAIGATGPIPFALLLIGLLVSGLVATLLLSTAAAADSYRLQDARAAAKDLSAQSERLQREVAGLQSAPELARRASTQGMVPVRDPARLVVRPDGTVAVVGTPKPAQAAAPPVPPAPPAAARNTGGTGGAGTPDGTVLDGASGSTGPGGT